MGPRTGVRPAPHWRHPGVPRGCTRSLRSRGTSSRRSRRCRPHSASARGDAARARSGRRRRTGARRRPGERRLHEGEGGRVRGPVVRLRVRRRDETAIVHGDSVSYGRSTTMPVSPSSRTSHRSASSHSVPQMSDRSEGAGGAATRGPQRERDPDRDASHRGWQARCESSSGKKWPLYTPVPVGVETVNVTVLLRLVATMSHQSTISFGKGKKFRHVTCLSTSAGMCSPTYSAGCITRMQTKMSSYYVLAFSRTKNPTNLKNQKKKSATVGARWTRPPPGIW